MSNPNNSWCNLRLFPSILSLVYRKKKAQHFPHYNILSGSWRVQWIFLFSRVSNPSLLNCFLYVLLFNSLTSFIIILCICLSNSISFLVVMFLNQTNKYKIKVVVTSITYKGTIISTVLLVTSFLTQAMKILAYLATWAHCWLVFCWLSTSIPKSFSSRQLGNHSSSNL